MEDAHILDLYFKRSEDAIAETQCKYGRMLLSISYGILRSWEDAGECEDDTYMKAWNTIPPTRPNVFSAFLSRIARNLSLDRYAQSHAQKRGGGEIPLFLDELTECLPDHNTESEANDSDLKELLNHFLATLKEDHRIIFMRRYWYGDSIAEIAAKRGFKESKVKTSLMRTRQKLKQAIEQEGYRL